MSEIEHLIPPYDPETFEPNLLLLISLEQIKRARFEDLQTSLLFWVEELKEIDQSIKFGGYDDERLRLSLKIHFHRISLESLLSIVNTILSSDGVRREDLVKRYNTELQRYIDKITHAFRDRPQVVDVDPRYADLANQEDDAFNQ